MDVVYLWTNETVVGISAPYNPEEITFVDNGNDFTMSMVGNAGSDTYDKPEVPADVLEGVWTAEVSDTCTVSTMFFHGVFRSYFVGSEDNTDDSCLDAWVSDCFMCVLCVFKIQIFPCHLGWSLQIEWQLHQYGHCVLSQGKSDFQ